MIDRAATLGVDASAELRVETIREKRYSAHIEEKSSGLVQSVINLTRQPHEAHAVIERMHAPGERGRRARLPLAPSGAAARGPA